MFELETCYYSQWFIIIIFFLFNVHIRTQQLVSLQHYVSNIELRISQWMNSITRILVRFSLRLTFKFSNHSIALSVTLSISDSLPWYSWIGQLSTIWSIVLIDLDLMIFFNIFVTRLPVLRYGLGQCDLGVYHFNAVQPNWCTVISHWYYYGLRCNSFKFS